MGSMYQPAMIATFAIFYIFMLFFCLTYYVFYAIGVYRLAKRKAVPHAWMAWVPVLHCIALGKVSAMPDKKRHTHIALPILEGVVLIAALFLIVMAFGLLRGNMHGPMYGFRGPSRFAAGNSFFLLGMLASYLVTLGAAIAYSIVFYMALHRVHRQFAPDFSTFFTVLSIVFGLYPFILFAVRNKPYIPQGVEVYAPYTPSYPPPQPPMQQAIEGQTPPVLESGNEPQS